MFFPLPIIDRLTQQGISFDISGRPKSIYSIWNKMQTKGVPFEEIYDLFAIRLVFDPVPDIPEKINAGIFTPLSPTFIRPSLTGLGTG